MTPEVLLKQWADMTVEQCNWDILDCVDKVKMKRQRTSRDEYVATMGNEVLKRKQALMHGGGCSFKVMADDRKIIEWVKLKAA
jgi:hypothetical protein